MPVATFGTHPPRVLIVDDSEDKRSVLNRLLGRRGYSVFEAHDAQQALAQAARISPDIVLLEVNLPDLSGIETLRRLRKSYDSSTLPVIMVTGEADSTIIAACFSAGANDYVSKPVQWLVLQARIETHLSLHRAHAELLLDRDKLEAAIQRRALMITRIDQVLHAEHERRVGPH
ncbi:MAG TPA: response regulator [Caulobacterales bacterium]|nr:response regulator [Caulobacterales bacterium]